MRTPITLIAVAFLAASPVMAGERTDTLTFRFDRSALATDDGAEKIYGAMRAKAWSLCDPRNELTRGAITACVDDVVGQWVGEAEDSRLRALHASAA